MQKNMTRTTRSLTFSALLVFLAVTLVLAQPPAGRGPEERGGRPGFGRRGGGFGPMNREDLKLVEEFDQNDDGWLDFDERTEAMAVVEERREQRGRRGPGGGRRGPGGRFGDEQPAEPGPAVSPDEVEHYPKAELYDTSVLRTLFLEFEAEDWEEELEAFKDTDVEVPVTVIVDGKSYPYVGVHFRGQSSYGMVPRGKKRSLNLSFDFLDEEQRLYGYKTLNLLNCAGDASMMSAVVYSHIARQFIPAARANFVHVVINGESWGIYANVQQFDKIFLKENFEGSKGTRWKVPGSPGGDGGLRYLGDELAEYKQRFDMKSNDGNKAWKALVELCQVLNETPLNDLDDQISKILNIDETLRFLALDVALVNSDGYWTRASDYYLFRNADGVFHVIPHDTNEAFNGSRGGPPGGRRGGRDRGGPREGQRGRGQPEDEREGAEPPDRSRFPDGPPPEGSGPPEGFDPPEGFRPPQGFGRGGQRGFGRGGVDLDPLVGLDSERMPLRSRLLAIPALREKYLEHMRSIAEGALDWETLGPFVESQRELIEEAVRRDTKKLASYEQFDEAVGALQEFANKRREYLLEYQVSKDLDK